MTGLAKLKHHRLSIAEIHNVVASLGIGTDRIVAILCGAVVDSMLRDVVSQMFENPKKVKISERNFSALLDLVDGFELFDEILVGDLRLLNEIRNVFAHCGMDISFDTVGLSEACLELQCKDVANIGLVKSRLVAGKKWRHVVSLEDDRLGPYKLLLRDGPGNMGFSTTIEPATKPREMFVNCAKSLVFLMFSFTYELQQRKQNGERA